MADYITLITSNEGLPQAKRWTPKGVLPAGKTTWYTAQERPLANLHELSALLAEIESDPMTSVIRGRKSLAPTTGTWTTRRLNDSFIEAPHHWVCIDVDKYQPVLWDPVGEPVGAALEYARARLPAEFHDANFHWQLSSKAGLPGGEGVLKIHLWFWLEQPRTGGDLRNWAEALDLEDAVDVALFKRTQPHYTAAPIIDPGVLCPVTQRHGFHEGGRDTVDLVFKDEWTDRTRSERELLPETTDDTARAFLGYDEIPKPVPWCTLEYVRDHILAYLDPEMGRDPWRDVLAALHHQGEGAWEWMEMADEWSRGSGTNYEEGAVEKTWDSFTIKKGSRTIRSLLKETEVARAAAVALLPPAEPAPPPKPEFTDQEKHDFVFQKKLQEVVAIDKASYLEGAFAQDVRDYDWSPGERDQITKAMRTQYKALTGTLVTPRVADGWTRPTPKTGGWPNVDADGKPACTHANLGRLLEMLGGSARYNQMTKEDEVTLPELDAVNDNAEGAKLMYIYSAAKENGLPMTAADVAGFINVLATRSSYNPALEWVESKVWDGVDRLPEWCATVVSPNPYVKEMIMRRWALQAIAVLFNTGDFQARGVLTFSGVQYAGKSRWLRSLAPPGMVRTGLLLDVHDKDSVKKAIGAWFCELGELDGTMRRSDLAALKAFISLEMDTFRRVYGRTESSYPRRTCFGASVNEAQFLQDATGNTRFWGVEVESINPDHKVDMQQLWAQVLVLYQAGEQHWMTPEEMALLNTSNKEFTVDDPLEDRLRSRLVLDGDRSAWKYTTLESLATFLQLPRTFKRGEFSALGRAVREVTGLKGVRKHEGRLVLLPSLDPLTQDFPDR